MDNYKSGAETGKPGSGTKKNLDAIAIAANIGVPSVVGKLESMMQPAEKTFDFLLDNIQKSAMEIGELEEKLHFVTEEAKALIKHKKRKPQQQSTKKFKRKPRKKYKK